ncbi:MAG: division/cell wall cluster transcriptional repressor MraZ [Nitrospirae bacterium]|nr:division/cell wall cluster transcriptional repressor MraZ [Nitrospirota bacterium]
MALFSGKYYFTVDPKGRIIIPAPFRDIMRSHYDGKVFIANAPMDKCLHVYPKAEWETLLEKAKGLSMTMQSARWFQRRVIGSGQEIELDKQGRVLIPSSHREDAGINLNSDIVIVGLINKMEVWERNEWNKVMERDSADTDAHAKELAAFI